MIPYVYYLTPVDKHKVLDLGYVFLRTAPFKENLKMFDNNPADFFEDDGQMDFFSICGSGILLKKWINGKLYISPCAVSVHSQYRGKNLGKLLYKSFLKGIELYRQEIKTLPYFANHTIIEDVDPTSAAANRVYASLERQSFIRFIKNSVKRDSRESYYESSLYNSGSDDLKGNVYKILRFPTDIQVEHIKTINLKHYCYYDDLEDPTYNLYEFREVGSGGT